MEYRFTLRIPQSRLDLINRFLNAAGPDDYQGEDDTISETAVFPDCCQMDIKCCGCDDAASWTEAVLFDVNGCQLACTDPEDQFTGEWILEHGGITYIVDVQPEDEHNNK